MRFKVLNKNGTSTFPIDEAPVLTDTKNETLDSATIVISNLSGKLEMEPYDIVVLQTDTGALIKYMCIDTFVEQMTCVNPKTYRYEIKLFSETKQLENIILPNLKITKVFGQTRSIYDYINQYMSEYSPMIRESGVRLLEEFDSLFEETIVWEGDHYELVVNFGTDESGYLTVPVPTSRLRVDAYAWVDDGTNDDYFHDNNCHIYSNEIDDDGRWRILFGINLGTLEGWNTGNLNYGSEDTSVYENNDWRRVHKWKWDTQTNRNKFSMECPEMQWNTPTLREVLNDLMMVADCIPTLRQGNLEFMDLTETGEDESDDPYINTITSSKSSDDYVSELQMKLVNVTNKTEGVNNLVTKIQYCHLNTPDSDATLSSNNIVLRTQYPIYNLKSVTLMFPYFAIDTDLHNHSNWLAKDLMNLVYDGKTFSLISEYQKWQTKPILYNSYAPTYLSDWAKYQNWSLYYTRGSNEISNLGNTNKYKTIFTTTWTLWEKLTEKMSMYEYSLSDSDYVTNPKWYNLLFKIEYETLEDCLFKASKSENPDNQRVVIDNQTNSMVDSYAQGFLEYQKANRLGNKQLQINARYPASYTGHKLSIGDTFEDSVVYQCEYQYFKNHTEVNALATKNYILREYFTGVKSKIRSWPIASGNQALTRTDIQKYYCEFSYAKHEESLGLYPLASENNIIQYLCSPTYDYTASPIKCGLVRTVGWSAITYQPDSAQTDDGYMNTYYLLDMTSRIVGNSLVFNTGFYDNYWAGQSYHTDKDPTVSGDTWIAKHSIELQNEGRSIALKNAALSGGGVPMYQHRYTDDNGEFGQLYLVFSDNLKIIPTFYISDGEGGYVEDYWDDIEPGQSWLNENANLTENSQRSLYYIYQRPRVYESCIKWYGDHTYNTEKMEFVFNYHKDSQEITNLSVQFEFSSDTTDIFFSKEWLNKQLAISLVNNDTSGYKGIFYNKSAYDFRRPNELPTSGYQTEAYVKIYNFPEDNITAGLYIAYMYSNGYDSQETAARMAVVFKDSRCLYINDGDATVNKVLLGLNNIPDGNCFGIQVDGRWYPSYLVHLNLLCDRNKNIYDPDNHYLIVDKI